jgi:plastocyanin
MTATVTYTSSGFSPDPVTIKQGGTVTFVNKSNGGMLVASNAHPTHTQYSGTSRQQHCPDTAGTAFDQCVAGSTYTFTFQKVGSWNYHNHVNADDGGTINVVQ